MKIHYLLTAALLETPWDDLHGKYTPDGLLRKVEYANGFNAAKKVANEIYVVDAISKTSPTDINEFTDKICYINKEYNIRYSKGHELLVVGKALDYFKFPEEDFIIKITGRYKVQSNKLEKMIDDNCDFIGKIKRNWVSSNMIAMRVKNWKACIAFNLEHKTIPGKAVERQIAYYLQSDKTIRSKHIDPLDLLTIRCKEHDEFYR